MEKLIDMLGNVYLLDNRNKFTIGRNRRNDIVVPPLDSNFRNIDFIFRHDNYYIEHILNSVSRYHAAIIRDNKGKLYLEDLNSTYGTYVDDERISPGVKVPLIEGTKIRLGEYELVYHEQS